MIEKICTRCGGWFEAETAWARICPECKRGKMRAHKYGDKPYEVIECPVDELGVPEYPLRARFSRSEVTETMRQRNFPDGMVFRVRGKVYEVHGKHLYAEDGTRVRTW